MLELLLHNTMRLRLQEAAPLTVAFMPMASKPVTMALAKVKAWAQSAYALRGRIWGGEVEVERCSPAGNQQKCSKPEPSAILG